MERYVAPPRPPGPPGLTDERSVLSDNLEFYRYTLLKKCDGLTPAQLKERPVTTSDLSLLGMVRHMAAVEQFWFEHSLLGREVTWYYDTDAAGDPDLDFHDLDGVPVDQVFANFEEARGTAQSIIEKTDIDERAARRPEWVETDINLRSIMVHMIEEYARHCGHADILRELIDGSTGY